MSRSSDRTPSGVTLTRLDLSNDTEQASAFLRAQPSEADPEARAEFGSWKTTAAVEVGGRLYALCEEGVGTEVTEDSPLVIDVYRHTSKGFGIVPVASLSLGPAEVRERMTGEPVLLEDLVRRFGSRLEANYALWLRTLSPLALAESTVTP